MTEVAMHTESTGDPRVVKWVVRDGLVSGSATIPTDSTADGLPPRWVELLDDGTIDSVQIRPGEIRVRISEPELWPVCAPALQSALTEFLRTGNTVVGEAAPQSDTELADGVRSVLTGPLADYVASHGGRIELADVVDGVVTVHLIGACRGCPSAGTTLRDGIEAHLRDAFPQIVSVQAREPDSPVSTGMRKLLPLSVKPSNG